MGEFRFHRLSVPSIQETPPLASVLDKRKLAAIGAKVVGQSIQVNGSMPITLTVDCREIYRRSMAWLGTMASHYLER